MNCKYDSGPSPEGYWNCDKYHYYDIVFEPCNDEMVCYEEDEEL